MKTYSSKYVILALSWRDVKFPTMGGAELFTHELLKRKVSENVEIVHFAPSFEGLPSEEFIDGVHYIRQGSLLSVIHHAKKYYGSRKDEIRFVIDQCNTFRFFTRFWVPPEKRIFFIHQLTREIWNINMKFPFNVIGRVLETPFLKLNKNDRTMTVSKSTKDDLLAVGFKDSNVRIIPVWLPDEIRNKPFCEEKKENVFIFVGRYAKYKGIDATLEAFGKIKNTFPDCKLWIVGKKNIRYIDEVLTPICLRNNLSIGDSEDCDVVTWGFVSDEKKFELQSKAKALVFPSVREGWGSIISEAAAWGTPSITYDAPGTRDAVDFGNAGYLCSKNDVEGIVECMKRVLLDEAEYREIQKKAWNFTNQFSSDRSGKEFSDWLDSLD